MLGLYLYTLLIGRKSCNMLSILNKLILQKKLQKLGKIMCFGQKSKNTTKTNTKKTLTTLTEPGIEPPASGTQKQILTSAPPSYCEK